MRRVVTGVNEQGRSYIVSDEQISGPETASRTIWTADPKTTAAWIAGLDPATIHPLDLPKGGVRWRELRIPPFSEYKVGHHVTSTVDFVYVLEGNVFLDLDEASVELHPGDCVVQQVTRHTWRHENDRPVRVLAVLISGGDS